MKQFTDAEMTALLSTARPYTVAILKSGPRFGTHGSDQIIWEHGRRNFALRNDGVLAIVLPVADSTMVCGVCVFAAGADETTSIMDADPGVAAGVFTVDIHPCVGFPGDSLP